MFSQKFLDPIAEKFIPIVSHRLTLLAMALVGLILGPYSLEAGKKSEPPLDWNSIVIFLIFGVIAIPLILKLHKIVNGETSARLAWRTFLCGALLIFCSGLSAALISAMDNSFGPPSILSVAMGAGLLSGLLISRKLR